MANANRARQCRHSASPAFKRQVRAVVVSVVGAAQVRPSSTIAGRRTAEGVGTVQPWLLRRRLLRPSTFVPPLDVASSLALRGLRQALPSLEPFSLLLELFSVRWLLAITPQRRQIVR